MCLSCQKRGKKEIKNKVVNFSLFSLKKFSIISISIQVVLLLRLRHAINHLFFVLIRKLVNLSNQFLGYELFR